MNTISFDDLRYSNAARMKEWQGAGAIDEMFTAVELVGEVGELLNVVKKIVRLERGISGTKESHEELRRMLSAEFGDCVICLDLLAQKMDIDLSMATAFKFNATSQKHKLATRLPDERRHDGRGPG